MTSSRRPKPKQQGPETFTFDAELWIWSANASWHFITVPPDPSDEIDACSEGLRGGFGSVRVRATIGSSTWETSVFPHTASGGYILPVKKPVRRAEDLEEGDVTTVTLQLLLEQTGQRRPSRSAAEPEPGAPTRPARSGGASAPRRRG